MIIIIVNKCYFISRFVATLELARIGEAKSIVFITSIYCIFQKEFSDVLRNCILTPHNDILFVIGVKKWDEIFRMTLKQLLHCGH